MKQKRFFLGILLFVMVMGVVGSWPPQQAAAGSGTAVSPIKATSLQTVPVSVLAEGQLVPNDYVNLAFQLGGEVVEIFVEEGEIVEAGDPLIKLDSTSVELVLSQAAAHVISAEAGVQAAQNQQTLAEAAVSTANSAVVIAQANLDLVQAGPLPEEIAAAEANLAAAEAAINQAAAIREDALDIVSESDIAQAEANLAAATAELLALQDQYDQIIDTCFESPDGSEVCPLYGPVEEHTRAQVEVAVARQTAAQVMLNFLNVGPTAGQRDVAGSAVSLAIARRDAAQSQLDLLLEGSSAEQIEKATVGVDQAALGVELAQANIQQAEAAVSQAQAVLEAAQAAEAAVQATLDRLTLVAPFKSTVANLDLNLGELVAPGVPIITLANQSRWKLETTDLSELDVAKIAEGGSVKISFDAIPETAVTGIVEKIAYIPGQLQGDVVYMVTILLDDSSDLPLRWGMTAVTEIESSHLTQIR